MFAQLLRAGFWVVAYRWLKPRIKRFALTLGIIPIVWLLHSEYLSYVDRAGDSTFLALSYLLKWLLIISSVLLFIFLPSNIPGENDSSSDKPSSSDSEKANFDSADGFDFLRKKKKLQNRAEKLLTRKTK